jgi:branched-chain amino acid transport system substrate-binding protein
MSLSSPRRHHRRPIAYKTLGKNDMKRLAATLLALFCATAPALAAEDYVIDAILPLSGPAAFVGGGEKLGIEALEELVNREGGINGRNLRIVFHDDTTSPQLAVQLMTTAKSSHPAVVLGSTITAMCNAMAPMVADGPVMYCFSPGVHPKIGGYEFSASVSTTDMSRALIHYFRQRGWTNLALIVTSDATGQDAERGIDEALTRPENSGVKMVARAHFNPGDVSVAAQIATIGAAKPQALIAWTTGTGLATILKGVNDAGLAIPVATTNGNQSVDQLAQYTGFLPKQLYIPSASFPKHDGLFKLDPRVEQAQQKLYAAFDAHHLPIDNQSVNGWDPTVMIVDALRHLGDKATSTQLRDYIANQTNYAGALGIYDFKSVPQRGLTVDDVVITRWNPATKAFDWVSKPAGDPLPND